jgi:hypothetical protein
MVRLSTPGSYEETEYGTPGKRKTTRSSKYRKSSIAQSLKEKELKK